MRSRRYVTKGSMTPNSSPPTPIAERLTREEFEALQWYRRQDGTVRTALKRWRQTGEVSALVPLVFRFLLAFSKLLD